MKATKEDQEAIEREIEAKSKKLLRDELEQRKASILKTAEEVFRTNPVGGVIFLYAMAPFSYATGRRSDHIGSFFLLAVTKHLRETRRKPKFLLAVNLLRAVRGQKPNWSKSARLQAMVRVDKFKKSGREWKRHLKILKESYRSFRSGNPSPPFMATAQTLDQLQKGQALSFTFER